MANTIAPPSNDEELLSKIASQMETFDESDAQNATLWLRIWCKNGKTHTTQFEVTKKITRPNRSGKRYSYIEVSNGCIKFNIEDQSAPSSIRKNDRDPSCFEPRLTSNTANTVNRITTTDVLQVLKTKLMIASINQLEITIADDALIDRIYITPYRILRGGEPLYSKYGYFNPGIQNAQTLLRNYTLNDLKKYIDDPNTNSTFYERITNILTNYNIPYTDTDLVVETMKKIPLEIEKEENLSLDLLSTVYDEHHGGDYASYELDQTSPEWNTWKNAIVITDSKFTYLDEESPNLSPRGGTRKTKRSHRKLKSRRTKHRRNRVRR